MASWTIVLAGPVEAGSSRPASLSWPGPRDASGSSAMSIRCSLRHASVFPGGRPAGGHPAGAYPASAETTASLAGSRPTTNWVGMPTPGIMLDTRSLGR